MHLWSKIINIFNSKDKYPKPESIDLKPVEIENFYSQLDDSCKGFIDYHDIIPLLFENTVIFFFYDLEDGNYFATDKDGNVYSCIHDVKPFVIKMNIKAKKLIESIQNKTFDIQKYFDDRYKGLF
ncbi:hypothetical protein AD998_14930 [bacterium 336/3]|nr:hypothetical protein AD998_14930 [bacterium 336/3]